MQQQPRRGGQSRSGVGGPRSEGLQELRGVQYGVALGEERRQRVPIHGCLCRRQLGGQSVAVGRDGIGEFEQLGMALGEGEHPAAQLGVRRATPDGFGLVMQQLA